MFATVSINTQVTIFSPCKRVGTLLIVNNNIRNVIFCYVNCLHVPYVLKGNICISDEEWLTGWFLLY